MVKDGMSSTRLWSVLALMSVSACHATDGERAPSVPIVDDDASREEPSPAPKSDATQDDDALRRCVTTCIERSQMQATVPEVIEANCRRSCAEEE